MVSKLSKIGIPIFLSGIVLFLLFTVIGVGIFPFSFSSSRADTLTVAPGNTEIIELSESNRHLPTFPLWAFVKTSFDISSFNDLIFNTTLRYDGNFQQELVQDTTIEINPSGGTELIFITKRNVITLTPAATSSSYTFTYEIENLGVGTLTIEDRSITVQYSLFTAIFPLLVALIGIIVFIVGFIVSRGKPSTSKRKKQVTTPSGGWEPTLQWGGGSATTGTTKTKKPRMAIKSTKTSGKTTKKAVQRPTGGAQTSCKFCGKNVPSSAFFCPSCYGKLR